MYSIMIRKYSSLFVWVILFITCLFSCKQKATSHSISPQDYDALVECINKTEITKLRQGDRYPMINMWMVVVEDRIFVRSWQGTKDGWYYKFLENEYGEIECGDVRYAVNGRTPNDLHKINNLINKQYISKYNEPKNATVAAQITEPERMKRTLELIVLKPIEQK